MAYAILHMKKIKSAGAAVGKTAHNHRLREVENADPGRKDWNQEYVNPEGPSFWQRLNERIEEAGIKSVRHDAVRGVELLLTASAEAFPRDAEGRAQDMRGSKWLQDNLDFVKEKYGAQNVVSCTLHQDELTPHIHAVVVPITDKGRLSAKELFSPQELVKLQDEYAAKMQPHGLVRGVRGSTAKHDDVRRYYGAQQLTREKVAEVARPVPVEAFRVEVAKPTPLDLLNLDKWKQQQEAVINAELSQRVAEVNQKLQTVATVAVAHSTAGDRARVLGQQLVASEQAKQTTAEQLQKEMQSNEKLTRGVQQLAVQAVQGDAPAPKVVAWAQGLREITRQQMEQTAAEVFKTAVRSSDEVESAMKAKGYPMSFDPQKGLEITCQKTGVRFHRDEVRPNGQDFHEQLCAAVERTQHQDKEQILNKQQSRSRDNGIGM